MNTSRKKPAPTLNLHLKLRVAGQPVSVDLPVPDGPARPRDLLPALQRLTNAVVTASERAAEQNGHRVSCAKGCGACCRQLVPITPAEAHHLRDVVEALPEPRRAAVKARFAAALQAVANAGLDRVLDNRSGLSAGQRQKLGLDYFALGLACPLLEEESCSIHPVRPLACREYLVTSPASECARPRADRVTLLPVPCRVSAQLAQLQTDPADPKAGWLPLIHALRWAGQHDEPPATRDGKQMMTQVIRQLSGANIG